MGSINIQFSVLQARYRNTMPEKRVVLEQVWSRMRSDPHDPAGLHALFPLIHRLAGSASSYGLEHLGDAALSVHDILDRYRVRSSPVEQARLPDLVRELEPPMDVLLQALAHEAEIARA